MYIKNDEIIGGDKITQTGKTNIVDKRTTSTNQKEWYERPLGKITIGILVATISAFVIALLNISEGSN
jgi:hypothetical protein